jgi:GNAT superfamily N-acetyltransferase
VGLVSNRAEPSRSTAGRTGLSVGELDIRPRDRHGQCDVRDDVVGWAALSPVSDRCVYGGVAENSVYIHPDALGRGVGRVPLEHLISSSEAAGIWTLPASRCTNDAGSGSSRLESASAGSTECGETHCCLSVAALWSDADPRQAATAFQREYCGAGHQPAQRQDHAQADLGNVGRGSGAGARHGCVADHP